MFTVYQHKNKINGKMYFGITMQKPEQRWGSNGINYKSSPYFYSASQKYGWNNFEHNILFENLTKEMACRKEQELIAEFNTTDRKYGYNCTTGGEFFQMTTEVKEKISAALIGNKNNLGHKCSEEKKRKISEAQIGRRFTEEHKKKLSEAAKKRHTPCSEETKKKISKNYPNKKKVYCEETGEIYESVHECARQLNIEATSVSRVCKEKGKSVHGYHLKYYNNT